MQYFINTLFQSLLWSWFTSQEMGSQVKLVQTMGLFLVLEQVGLDIKLDDKSNDQLFNTY